eukprot:tig00000158_g10202.t1
MQPVASSSSSQLRRDPPELLFAWLKQEYAAFERFALVPRRFSNAEIEEDFQQQWSHDTDMNTRSLLGARGSILYAFVSFVAFTSLFLAGYYRGTLSLARGGGAGPTAHLIAIIVSAGFPPLIAAFSSWLSLSRENRRLSFSFALLAIYGNTYYTARTAATIGFFLTRVCVHSTIGPLFLGLPYTHALLLNGCGALLSVAFLMEFALEPHDGNDAWDAALSLPSCIASALFGILAALRAEHSARKSFLSKLLVKTESDLLRNRSSSFVDELAIFSPHFNLHPLLPLVQSVSEALDLSSPTSFAVNVLGEVFDGLVQEGNAKHAEMVSVAVRCILSSARTGSTLADSDPAEAKMQNKEDVAALQDFKEWTSAFTGQKSPPASESVQSKSLRSATLASLVAPALGSNSLRGPRPSSGRGSGQGQGLAGASGHGSSSSPVTAAAPSAAPMETISTELAGIAQAAVSDRWDDFDAISLEQSSLGRPLEILATEIGRHSGILAENNVDVARFQAFVANIEAGYRRVPYHSSTHAADVVQALSWLLNTGGLRAHLRPIDALAALTAAVIHDVAHEGRNNGFEIATQSELAILYNDQSVLENYSLNLAFGALRDPATNFLSHLPKIQRAEFRKTVIAAVLATDMARHFEKVGEFKARIVASTLHAQAPAQDGLRVEGGAGGVGSSRSEPRHASAITDREESLSPRRRGSGGTGSLAVQFAPPTDADRALFIALCLKSWDQVADISNAGRPRYQHVEWTARVSEEFFLQGDEERKLGIPISPYCDRLTTMPSAATAGFIGFLALPLLEAWSSRFPAAKALVKHAQSNLAHWKGGTKKPS